METLGLKRAALGHTVGSRTRAYLDIRYWIFLRDAYLGRPQSPEHKELLELFSERVAAGSHICPIEQTVLLELLKQQDPGKRRALVQIIDRLSLGVALVSQYERVFLEVLAFVRQSITGSLPTKGAEIHEVWTKVGYLLGHGTLTSSTMSAQELVQLNDFFQRQVWEISLEALLDMIGMDSKPPTMTHERTVEALNRGKVRAGDFKTRKALYESELRGVLDAYEPALNEVMEFLYTTLTGAPVADHEFAKAKPGEGLITLICAAAQKNDLRRVLPTIHLLASVYTEMQWDRHRSYKPNDIDDFGHATAAMPYFDIFLTERSLKSLVERLKLDAIFKTSVLASVQDALAALRKDW